VSRPRAAGRAVQCVCPRPSASVLRAGAAPAAGEIAGGAGARLVPAGSCARPLTSMAATAAAAAASASLSLPRSLSLSLFSLAGGVRGPGGDWRRARPDGRSGPWGGGWGERAPAGPAPRPECGQWAGAAGGGRGAGRHAGRAPAGAQAGVKARGLARSQGVLHPPHPWPDSREIKSAR
jgi:hypothetical protein